MSTDGRSRTIRGELTAEEREFGAELLDCEIGPRPATVADCPEGPCPYIGCKYHLYSEITHVGSLKISWPRREPTELPETCSLRAAARDGMTLQEVGDVMNCTRERVRQIEKKALHKVRRACERLGIDMRSFAEQLGQSRDRQTPAMETK